MALVCDGLAANRKLFHLHNPEGKAKRYHLQSENPYAEDGRELYFFVILHTLLNV